MFELVDSIGAGRYLWEAFVKKHRPPYDCLASQASATLLNEAKGLALILASSNDVPDDERCVFIQLRDLPNNEVLVDVTLDCDLLYLRGEAFGVPADELAATETLEMYGPDLVGDWELVEGSEVEMEEEHA